MPSPPSPVAVGAVVKVTWPPGPIVAVGYRPNDSSLAPPGSASPIPATFLTPAGPDTYTAVGGGPGSIDAAKTTSPLEPSAGQDPKLEKTPPAGAGSPSATTFFRC